MVIPVPVCSADDDDDVAVDDGVATAMAPIVMAMVQLSGTTRSTN
jgi:hypothetical protein